ncbi:MAG: aminotransferase class I/II-fold pyridoxal phosphate-dependent enzyme [bacterium]|nr:aminotransferase class I/II-fold pyridoxal phosphate-dependent enzyme [bacterium]
MTNLLTTRCAEFLSDLEAKRQKKRFLTLTSPMGPTAQIEGVGDVVVLCSNNYLGLANHPEVVAAGQRGLEQYGAGTASVRFICGTFDCHRQIESRIADFVGCPAALSYVSCWNANEAVFPTLMTPGDVVLSDELNHASLIDGMRLMSKKVEKTVYRHSDIDHLRELLQQHADKPCRMVVTDGVFSMEGDVAKLPELIAVCREHNAVLVVDDSHGIGVLGDSGRGTADYFNCLGEVDIITGTLGKALGGGAGGYIAASNEIIEVLAQRGRPSLFSNALPATIACSADKAIELVQNEPSMVGKLHQNVATIRSGLSDLGFDCPDSPTAIIPIMIGDAAEAIVKSDRLLELGVMVIGFGFPVVPKGEARLRVQVSAALEPEHIERVLDAFAKL